ncbi:hypothetical protein K469DRAFT_694717 [Zopfia rhizophila CBS 207.26]|uniref:Uncharacterized protein n=1 Tax=Zopfia rhizophila CBS 207.26 TaxID=1314779 RepID=A0A6A6ENU6_9PEZI|nr:hypothetical protein K469DRAFT_694717 [Zopfia rhizophila CBS 207.26]
MENVKPEHKDNTSEKQDNDTTQTLSSPRSTSSTTRLSEKIDEESTDDTSNTTDQAREEPAEERVLESEPDRKAKMSTETKGSPDETDKKADLPAEDTLNDGPSDKEKVKRDKSLIESTASRGRIGSIKASRRAIPAPIQERASDGSSGFKQPNGHSFLPRGLNPAAIALQPKKTLTHHSTEPKQRVVMDQSPHLADMSVRFRMLVEFRLETGHHFRILTHALVLHRTRRKPKSASD